jgi:hypothetical protein
MMKPVGWVETGLSGPGEAHRFAANMVGLARP